MANLANASLRTEADADPPPRTSPNLALVSPPAPGERARELFADARTASLDHLSALAEQITVVRQLLETVIDAGDLYVPGVRDFSIRLTEDLFWRSKTLEMLSQRQAESRARASQGLKYRLAPVV